MNAAGVNVSGAMNAAQVSPHLQPATEKSKVSLPVYRLEPPDVLLIGFEPYRDRLDSSYSPATNPFELLELDSGPHGVSLE